MGGSVGKTGVSVVRLLQLYKETKTMIDPSQVKVINSFPSAVEPISDPTAVVNLSKELHKKGLKLKGEFMQEDGTVKYAGIRESSGYKEFEEQTGLLQAVDMKGLNEGEKKAFLLNIYNTLTLHALAGVVTTERSVLKLQKFWQMYAYRIGEHRYSLDDIEHGILRCNQLHPTYKDYFFKEGDPRRDFVMKELDPRIHFALNCGAKSCPPIRVFSAENLDSALDMAAKAFCQGSIEIDVNKKVVRVSKILDWYRKDFGSSEKEVMDTILPFCKDEEKEQFTKIKDSFALKFFDYDWSIH